MKLRVLFLANAASIHTQRWAMGLSAEFSIAIFSFEPARIEGVEVVELNSPFDGLLRYLWVLPFLRKEIKKRKPHIVHAHYAGGYGMLGMLCGFHPFILSVWGSDVYLMPRRSFFHRLALQRMLARADLLCSTSHAMAIEARQYVVAEFKLTPFGVDCDTYRAAPYNGDKLVIGTVKKLHHLYGIDRLLQAFAVVREAKPLLELRLLIVGDGDEREALIDLAVQLGIEGSVDFIGAAKQVDVPALLNEMAVFVALSRSESFGVAVLEASACQLPVIVSDAGGLNEVVNHGETGYIIVDGDPRLAALAIIRLLDDELLRTQMGKAGRELVQTRYQWQDSVKNMAGLYRQICQEFSA